MSSFKIVAGREEHIPSLMALIQELAEFEKAPEMVINTAEQLKEDWQKHKSFDFLVAEKEGEVIGISLYYPRYSTWRGRCLYLEDLYVKSEYRGEGIGLALLRATAEEGKKAGVNRMDWQVLDWNTSAVKFYEKEGAYVEKEWWNCKLPLNEKG
jgi:GNAT superfamily N-acetyltransferase